MGTQKEPPYCWNVFIEAVNKGILERFSDKNKSPKNNLIDTDKNAIEYFSKCNDLVITIADQGGVTVILEKD